MVRLSSIVFLIFLVLLTGCKKNPDTTKLWEFSFTYNGQTYTNPDYGSPIEIDGEVIGLEIRKPEVLGGVVHFIWRNSLTDNCAYILPTGMDILYNDNTCTFSSSGGPVDSSLIYSYQSGGKQNYTVSNCRDKKDLFSGTVLHICAISGSFSLEIMNNRGIVKKITGTFKDPEVIM